MKKYYINYQLSREAYSICPQLIEPKQCYVNIFHMLTECSEKFRLKKWKIAYGYMCIMPLVYVRHCFIIDDNGSVIDPTIFAIKALPENESLEYLVMSVFDDVNIYLDAVQQEDNYPALLEHFRNEDKQAWEWGLNNGIVLLT